MESNLSTILEFQTPRAPGMYVDGGVLPEDLLMEILLTLPVKHLLRLRCVCKSWCALIDDFNFIKRHYGFQYSLCQRDGDIPFICYGPQPDLCSYDLHLCLFSKLNVEDPTYPAPDLLRDSAPSFASNPEFFNKAYFVGVVNGIVCVIWDSNDIGLWNPATREFKAISPWLYRPNNFLGSFGFGFDCVSNDFKILRGNCSADATNRPEVYSLASNTWKGVTVPSAYDLRSRDGFMEAYLNGVGYWIVYSAPSGTTQIMSFNFGTEVLEVFNSPQNAFDYDIGGHAWTNITFYKECLAFVVTPTDEEEVVRNLDVWVVTEFHDNTGIPVAWQRILTIGPFPPPANVLGFETFRMDGDLLLTIKSPGVVIESSLYNPSSATFHNFGFSISTLWGYVGSLFPLSKKLA